MPDIYIYIYIYLYIASSSHNGRSHINTLRPRQNGRHFSDDFSKCISLNLNVSSSIKFHWSGAPSVQFTIFQL